MLIDPDERMIFQGSLELPTTVWADNPRTLVAPEIFHGYALPAKQGGVITLQVRAASCGEIAPVVYLFGPRADGTRGQALATELEALGNCEEGAAIKRFELPLGSGNGSYLVIVTSADGSGHYQLDATCNLWPCAPEERYTWDRSRTDTEGSSDPYVLDEAGSFLFDRIFRLSEGLGNDFAGGERRPNMREVHDGPLGGPDAQSCVSCHHREPSGSGTRRENIFAAGNGVDRDLALERTPPALRGLGLRQAIAASIERELRAQVADVAAAAAANGAAVTGKLSVTSVDGDPVCFGNATVNPDGSVDQASALEGLDHPGNGPIKLRPFGWKGRERTLRDFVRGGFRVHFGLQAGEKIDAYCDDESPSAADTELFRKTWGDSYPTCRDPDQDGIVDEVTSGQLSAVAVYLMMLPPPPPFDRSGEGQARFDAGYALFKQAGCASCHTRAFALADRALLADTEEGQTGVEIPLPPHTGDIEVWSDFKRHDMGGLADVKVFVNDPAPPIGQRWFITPPLWDLAQSAPYLHDGRVDTIQEAIVAHGGETAAQEARDAFAALSPGDKEVLLEFLGSLGREN